jgi:2-polyprenyl-6-methoxyphenol hydroxylase-like FAD-dependent oxidoreductase
VSGRTHTALVVGAGIGGLAAALSLRRAGWQVRVFERAAAPRELGFALALAPNAVAALEELGIAREVVARASAATIGEIRRSDGRVLRRFHFSPARVSTNPAMVVALRQVLHGVLLDAVGLDAISMSSEAADFESTTDGVTLLLADGRAVIGDILIGADGAGSVIRRRLHPNEPASRPSGFWALRGVTHGVEARLDWLPPGLSGVGYFGPGVEAAIARASDTALYWYMSLLSRDVARGPDNPAAALAHHTVGFDARFRAVSSASAADEMRLDELLERDPLTEWGAGRVTLAGDAAHPVLPHTGQGAAQALEDAVALGLALRSSSEPEQALRRYEEVRKRRTRRFIALGRRIARVTTTRNPLITAARNLAIRVVPSSLVLRAANRAQRDPHRALR